ncbi:MAG: hypothetical protein V1870_04605 [Candidatus Aenigmatarchaeota archaeon]
MTEMIIYNDFQKLDLRVGRILEAERIAGTDKLMKLQVDVGEKIQPVAGIADNYSADELIDENIIVLVNLVSRKLKGVESHGMLLAAVVDGKSVLLTTDRDANLGDSVM